MATAAEAIVLSSSPDPPTRTPRSTLNDADKLLETSPLDQTPLPVPSLADVFRPPSRSRFFADANVADKPARKKRQPARKSDTTDPDATKAPAKPRQRAKKATKEQEPKSAALGDLETGALDSRDNTAKKAAPLKKAGARTSKKAKETGNMKLAGKVTKASSEPQAKKASKASKESDPKQTPAAGDIGIAQTNALGENEHLQLEEAMARRRDWTPPRESGPEAVTAVDEETESRKADGFGKLMCSYNYSGLDSDARDIPLNIDGGAPTKRRRIELVDPGLQSLVSSKADQSDSSSGAKSKKKPRTQKRFTTLTARMTAQYTVNETPDDDLMDDVVPYISKAKSRRKTKSTNEEPAFTVLSPEAAVKALDAQDLIFGTCSQLEREESPQTLRDIQRAIRESESLASPASGWSSGRQTPIRSGTRLTGTKNLWGVAARDINGSLVRAAELDSVDPTDVSQASKENQSKSTSLSTAFEDDDWFDLDYGRRAPSKSMPTLQQKISEPFADTQQLPVTEVPVAEVPVAKAAAKTVPVTNVSLPAAQNPKVVKSSQQADIQPPSMPHYPGFTDAELSKQVAVFGFKSIKGRKKMIDLLQKCWESKHGTLSKPTEDSSQAQIAPSETTVQSAQPKPKPKAKSKPVASSKSVSIDKAAQAKSRALASPKKTPQKAAGTGTPRSSYIDVDEIQDSEEELFLSPIRVQQRHTERPPTNPPQEHTLNTVTKEAPQSPTKRKPTTKTSRSKTTTSSVSKLKSNTAVSSARSSLPDISAQITKAVRLQATVLPLSSSTGSRIRPTWHEKILMYDPIILEDLTTWLNVEGLGLVEEDREVSSWDVRKWCESKGICCCWKQNASW